MGSQQMDKYETRLFINNEYVEAKSGETFELRNPADATFVVSNVHVAGPDDVEAAVDAATTAFKTGPWSKFSGAQRAKCMLKFADLLDANVEKLAILETLVMGQPITISKMLAGAFSKWWRYYAGFADKLHGHVFPEDGDNLYKIIRYEPLGVCAGIGAWNSTLLFVTFKMAPALAAGNTCIFKSSEKAPLGAILVASLFKEAGFPAGVVNIITGMGQTGALLAAHPRIAKVSFTGSTATGRKVQDAANKSNMKRCTLELGGKSAALIFNDANMANALSQNAQGLLLNSGQVCTAPSRMLVQSDIAGDFIQALKAHYEGARHMMGDTLDPKTFFGPVADKAQFENVMRYIEEGKKSGAELLTGGTQKGSIGYYIEPTIFVDPPTASSIYQEEIFGPVVVIKTFTTEDEGIQLANASEFGLSATVYTDDLTRALRVTAKLEAGIVSVNSAYHPSPTSPHGGFKMSGNGRESGLDGLKGYLESKTIHINMAMPAKE